MSKSTSKPVRRGRLARLVLGLILLGMMALGLALLCILIPQDLSDLEGYGEEHPQAARDLGRVLEESVKRGHEVTLGEAEINRWLAGHVRMGQEGWLASHVSKPAVGVRLEDGLAEVILERRVWGKRLTFSMFVRLARLQDRTQVVLHGGPYLEAFSSFKRGGRFGCLTVPQGYLHLVKSAFFKLAGSCSKEWNAALGEMKEVRIESGRLVLVPPKPETFD